ncbi:MAG: uncharacterized protein JWR01_880 [Subtercola sp.]|nr:uncharacterized protein [Subtercola sp.]
MQVTRLLLLADTHLPKRARDLPPEVWQAVDAAEVVFHAGDWVDLETYERLTARVRAAGGTFVGVWGNNDGPELRSLLPEVATVDVGGLRFRMTHETGPATGREARADAAFPGVDVLVFGHSHIPWDSVTPGGLRLLNPGSPTDRRRQPFCTYLTATATPTPPGGSLTDVTLHHLPLR